MIKKYSLKQKLDSVTCCKGEDDHGRNYDSSLGSSLLALALIGFVIYRRKTKVS